MTHLYNVCYIIEKTLLSAKIFNYSSFKSGEFLKTLKVCVVLDS